MDCYVGASTGAFKGAVLRDNTFQNFNEIKSLDPKQDEITAMIWNDELQTEILMAKLNRQLHIFDTEENEQSLLFEVDGGTGPIKGLHKKDEKIFTCVESGLMKAYNEQNSEVISEWSVGPGVSMMRGSTDKNELVTGGIRNLVKTWDIETGKQTWTGRNVPLDKLGLEVPIMCSDVRFIPGQNTILEATKTYEMRVYDPRAQRRPVKRIPFMENPIMSTSLTYRENYILAANSIGEMGLFDLRSKVHPICKFKGQSGSIRSIEGHPTSPLCASVGIDRFLRIHDLQTKKLIHKIYCKARLNRVLMKNNLSIMNKGTKKEIDEDEKEYGKMKSNGYRSDENDSNESEDDENIDEIWEGMDSAVDKSNKRAEQSEESDDDEIESPKPKKRKVEKANGRKRKDTESTNDELDAVEPQKKKKIAQGRKRKEAVEEEIEIKNEVLMDDEDDDNSKIVEKSAPKKKKIIKKKKKV